MTFLRYTQETTMTDEERRHLIWLRDTLTEALENINGMLAESGGGKIHKVRGETVSLPDSFSEDKEKFIAP